MSFGNKLCDFFIKGKYSEEKLDKIRKEFDEIDEMNPTITLCSNLIDNDRPSSSNNVKSTSSYYGN